MWSCSFGLCPLIWRHFNVEKHDCHIIPGTVVRTFYGGVVWLWFDGMTNRMIVVNVVASLDE